MHLKRHFSANIAQTTVFFRIFASENQKLIMPHFGSASLAMGSHTGWDIAIP